MILRKTYVDLLHTKKIDKITLNIFSTRSYFFLSFLFASPNELIYQ